MSTIRLQILRQQLANQQAKVETARQTMQNAARDWSAWRIANPLKPVVASPDVVCDAPAEPDNQATTDVVWKSTLPTEPGVYIAGPSCDVDMRCYWNGRNWSAHWASDADPKVIAYCKTGLRQPGVKWLSLVEPDNTAEWKSTAPPEPGVYVASRYHAQNIRMYWDGRNWSLGWLVDSSAGEIAFRRATIQNDSTGIMWLRRDDTANDTTAREWTSTIPPAPGKYIASSCRNDDMVRFWNGRAWSDFWRTSATDEEIAVRMKEFPLGLGPAGIQWLRSV